MAKGNSCGLLVACMGPRRAQYAPGCALVHCHVGRCVSWMGVLALGECALQVGRRKRSFECTIYEQQVKKRMWDAARVRTACCGAFTAGP